MTDPRKFFWWLLTLATLAASCSPPQPAVPVRAVNPYQADYMTDEVSAFSTTGALLWKRKVPGSIPGVRPPYLLYDRDRVYVADGGVVALSPRNGATLWDSPGPCHRLALIGDLLLAVDCTSDTYVGPKGRLLMARSILDGTEVFHTQLPVNDFESNAPEEMTGLFLVQSDRGPNSDGKALLVDHKGNVWKDLDRYITGGTVIGESRIFSTGKDVLCISPRGDVLWTAEFAHSEWIPGGGLSVLPDQGLVAFVYCQIADSGVQVMRIASSGEVLWRHECARLGVKHSQYSHQATLSFDTSKITIHSIGSGGTFTESVDLATGARLSRK